MKFKNKFKEYCKNNREWARNEDRIGRSACIKHLPTFIDEISHLEDHPDKYDIDLIAYNKDGEIYKYVEAEHSNSWNSLTFPYKRMNVPIRKKKFFEKYKDSLYVMVNKDSTCMGVVHSEDILNSYIREVSNKYNKKGEYFYSVSLKDIEFLVA